MFWQQRFFKQSVFTFFHTKQSGDQERMGAYNFGNQKKDLPETGTSCIEKI